MLLLVTPPMTQVNTPYPATAFLTGYLRQRGEEVAQWDASIALFHRIFASTGLEMIAEVIVDNLEHGEEGGPATHFFMAHVDRYVSSVDAVVRFLQGQDPTLAARIASRRWLPEGPRFDALDDEQLFWSFGAVGVQDLAKLIASTYIDELTDVIQESIDPRFGLSRYAERLAESQLRFDPLIEALNAPGTLIDALIDDHVDELLETFEPSVVAFTVPFPGNVYGALRMAARVRQRAPEISLLMGGGYVNTELRHLEDARLFDWIDFLTYDDGERPMERLLAYLRGEASVDTLVRTLTRVDGALARYHDATAPPVRFKDSGTPTYDGIPLDAYVSLLEMANPMHRLWSDGHWNKVMVAHGCYWAKCAFCDVTLDYIGRFDPVAADVVVDRMEALIDETGRTGFHFVDEAAPPKVLGGISRRLVERGVTASWWGNIRFERAYDDALVQQMADAGCVAVTGGLEVASDRLLALMQKGVTIDQVARVTRRFVEAGVMVHAYLMYGFPSQTVQETVDSLEIVRQLFAAGCLHSAFWHRLSVTIHNPIAAEPDRFGVQIADPLAAAAPPDGRFAVNDLAFVDPTGVDHDALGEGLRRAVYNFMHGVGLEADVREWFSVPVPATTHAPDRITSALDGAS